MLQRQHCSQDAREASGWLQMADIGFDGTNGQRIRRLALLAKRMANRTCLRRVANGCPGAMGFKII